MHFEEQGAVHKALRQFVGKLEGLGIPYALADGMALFLHGFRRFTEDVAIVVTLPACRPSSRRSTAAATCRRSPGARICATPNSG